ncbi:MAG: response regulator transcription factor [Dehalococcoidales bacterium]|nr:response regulator transcription factor [Dehalococcoidales bacterium]
MARVLLAANGVDGLDLAQRGLVTAGFDLHTSTVDDFRQALAECDPNLVLLDLDDVEPQALGMIKELRARNYVPLLAVSSDERWLVPSLSAGADNYLGKPIDLPTLMAKMFALLRRSGYQTDTPQVVSMGALAINLDERRATMDGNALTLTPTEYRILSTLARNVGRVVSPAELVSLALGYEEPEQAARDIVKVHIHNLRRKLKTGNNLNDHVVTVPGFGYTLREGTAADAVAARSYRVRRAAMG